LATGFGAISDNFGRKMAMLGAVFNFNFTLQCMLMCPKILLIICKCLERLRYLKEFQIGALVFEFFYGFRIWGKESMEYGNMIWAVTCHSAHRFCHQPRIGATPRIAGFGHGGTGDCVGIGK